MAGKKATKRSVRSSTEKTGAKKTGGSVKKAPVRKAKPRKKTKKKASRSRLERGNWVEAGLTHLQDSAVHDIRIDLLARQLEVTKGSFYSHFRHRDELLEAIFDDWYQSSSERFLELMDSLKGTAWGKIRKVVQNGAERRILLVDQVFREWGRVDPQVQERMARIDQRRIDLLARLIEELGFKSAQAKQRATVFYGWALSQVYFLSDRWEKDPNVRAEQALEVLRILTEGTKKKRP